MNPSKHPNSDPANDIAIISAQPGDRFAIDHLMQLYIHDFSEQWADQERGELGDDGRFPEYPLDPYWDDPDHLPFLVRRAGHLIGFVLLNREAHSGMPVDWSMAEFFIVRKHRRGGIGTRVAHAIFSRYPGQWEAAVARRNTPALAFWRKAVQSHAGVAAIEEHDSNDTRWNGHVIRFYTQM